MTVPAPVQKGMQDTEKAAKPDHAAPNRPFTELSYKRLYKDALQPATGRARTSPYLSQDATHDILICDLEMTPSKSSTINFVADSESTTSTSQ